VTSVAAGTGLQGSPNPITTAGAINLAPAFQLPQGCANGQVPKSNGAGGWTCAADTAGTGTVTSLTAGSGITLTPSTITTTGTIAADTSFVQRRVSAFCPVGSAIRIIDVSGAVSCETDDSGPVNAFVNGGNAFGATAVLGTTDNQALDIRTNGSRVMRYAPNAISPNLIGGHPQNSVDAGVRGATIAGGGVAVGDSDPNFTLENPNRVTDHYGTVGGGYGNQAGGNLGLGFACFATVSGGWNNVASDQFAAVGGGNRNTASGSSSAIGGGQQNSASGNFSAIAGGALNVAGGFQGAVPGGLLNSAGGDRSFAGGRRAKVRDAAAVGGGDTNGDEGTFLWADHTDLDFTSVGPNEFAVRATGGFRFVTAVDGAGSPTQMVSIQTDGSVGINTTTSSLDTNLTIVDATRPSLAFRGASSDQAESGRIVFGEGGFNNCRGGFIHHDGNANRFYIGTHDSGDCLVGNDIRILQMNRTTGFLGVLTGPSATNPIVVGTDNTSRSVYPAQCRLPSPQRLHCLSWASPDSDSRADSAAAERDGACTKGSRGSPSVFYVTVAVRADEPATAAPRAIPRAASRRACRDGDPRPADLRSPRGR
jgi:hypothetical protein